MDFGYIYKISYGELNYYGSSLKNDRFRKHKNCYKKWKDGKSTYTSSFKLFEEAEKNGELPTFEIQLCFDKYVCVKCMRKEEQKWIDDNECVNIQNAYRDKKEYQTKYNKEYYEENKDQLITWQKEYYQANKEQKKEYDKEYSQKNKQKLKEKKRIWIEANKEQLKEKRRIWQEANKEKMREYLKQYYLRKKLEKNK